MSGLLVFVGMLLAQFLVFALAVAVDAARVKASYEPPIEWVGR